MNLVNERLNVKINLLTIVAFTFFSFSSCKKDGEIPSNILTSKTWKKGLNDKNPSTNPAGTVLYYAVKSCEQDDSFKFDSDGNLKLTRATDKCDQTELQTETQTYTINRTTKELTINGAKFILAEESGSQIKYYASIPAASGFQYLIYLLQ